VLERAADPLEVGQFATHLLVLPLRIGLAVTSEWSVFGAQYRWGTMGKRYWNNA